MDKEPEKINAEHQKSSPVSVKVGDPKKQSLSTVALTIPFFSLMFSFL